MGDEREEGRFRDMDWVHCVTLDDVEVGVVPWKGSGKAAAVRIAGREASSIPFETVRKLCSQLRVTGCWNQQKAVMLQRLALTKMSREAEMEEVAGVDESDEKEAGLNATFRVLNVVFSKKLVMLLSEISAAGKKRKDVGQKTAEMRFWNDVQAEFLSREQYGRVEFEHPAFEQAVIDPSRVSAFDSMELKVLYRKALEAYELAIVNAEKVEVVSGDFFEHCAGRLDALYFYFHLEEQAVTTRRGILSSLHPQDSNPDHLSDADSEKYIPGIIEPQERVGGSRLRSKFSSQKVSCKAQKRSRQFAHAFTAEVRQDDNLVNAKLQYLRKKEEKNAWELFASLNNQIVALKNHIGSKQLLDTDRQQFMTDLAMIEARKLQLREELTRQTLQATSSTTRPLSVNAKKHGKGRGTPRASRC
mmetsp:Transcript_10775/g.21615  ORF Transcript_10775/g.21615 Transcript_10775/m.21615 type:complete len:417 (-) Transcript_10775:8-1258(-)|eukprot:CAMPEP_0184686288 /NCGR_PEP_ID=MMETSP0312-20130426/21919_1 /TAXON_ID=31354 /ORGANISM="Compsopogon coeruleus, Strain SAG 36.94" /LENGTH=416 /DNA_ID=CAMNT_0027141221 /DNA_START=243 /DNA_END=1493 /DNA_ORIENTATION=-